ncbi:MAG: lamin tail domain-containing protein [Sporocytophaga sp.]|uniref:lamin tail domain-containing protein n=1 Tax=Sporocytophaga sp. TaxID=2231183 RepID=UPI001B1EFD96|nr:lamin tail domain-containing protein [Sporocytophaga sp.]MBO9701115.1 lamin tail domain-containing protein [Sporocytophaga sp.]
MKKIVIFKIYCLLFAINALAQSDLVITEILYNQPGNDTLEFIELYNKGNQSLNLSGYKVTSGFDYVFPDYTLKPGNYVVVARYADFFEQTFGVTPLQWDSGALSNSGEKIVIKTPAGIIADSVEYDNKEPWDDRADGEGSSLVLCNVNSNNAFGYYWAASNDIGGIFDDGSLIYASPGDGNSVCNEPGDTYPPLVKRIYAPQNNIVKLVFNEPLNASSAQTLSNYTGLNVSSATLSGSGDTVILVLSVPLGIGNLNSINVSNITDVIGNKFISQSFSFIFNNTKAPLVISEIMYNNPGTDTLEFIELYNNGPEAINIGGYYFSDGIDFVFPSVVVASHQYIVVCAYQTYFNSFFNLSNTYQWTSGSLNNSGEKIILRNSADVIVDQVEYSFSSPWPMQADGTGPSLKFCDADKDNNQGANWSYSDVYVKDYLDFPIYATPGIADEVCVLSLFGQMPSEHKFGVYPNPSNGIFKLDLESATRTSVEVLNSLGQVIYLKENVSANEEINISDQKKGIYYIRLKNLDKDSFSSAKLVVE